MKNIKLSSLFLSICLLIIAGNIIGCSEKGIIQDNTLNNQFDLTMCKWQIDSLTLGEAFQNDKVDQYSGQSRISNLFVKELYEAESDLMYFEFKKNGRAHFGFLDSIKQEECNFSYSHSESQITFSLTDPFSLQTENYNVEYFFSEDDVAPCLLINDSDYVIYFLSCK